MHKFNRFSILHEQDIFIDYTHSSEDKLGGPPNIKVLCR